MLILSSTEPEYSVVEKSVRTSLQLDHSRISIQNLLDQVVGKSRRLSKVQDMQEDTLGEIQDLLLDLQQLVQELE